MFKSTAFSSLLLLDLLFSNPYSYFLSHPLLFFSLVHSLTHSLYSLALSLSLSLSLNLFTYIFFFRPLTVQEDFCLSPLVREQQAHRCLLFEKQKARGGVIDLSQPTYITVPGVSRISSSSSTQSATPTSSTSSLASVLAGASAPVATAARAKAGVAETT